jgi:hypothetical protein
MLGWSSSGNPSVHSCPMWWKDFSMHTLSAQQPNPVDWCRLQSRRGCVQSVRCENAQGSWIQRTKLSLPSWPTLLDRRRPTSPDVVKRKKTPRGSRAMLGRCATRELVVGNPHGLGWTLGAHAHDIILFMSPPQAYALL